MNAFECAFEVRYEQVDGAGLMRPASMIETMMETAVKNCFSAGYSVFDMLKDGLGWVLRGGNLIISKLPEYAETINIQTWISKWMGFQGVREFVVSNQEGEQLAHCSSVWAMFDLIRRIPHKVAEVFKTKWCYKERSVTRLSLLKHPLEIENVLSQKDIEVMRHDIDTNGHAHNLSYVDWVFETLPERYLKRRLISLDGSFLREVTDVDRVRCVVGENGEGELAHNILSEDGKVVYATGISRWDGSLLA